MNRRSVLLTLATLGALVSVVGGVGLFAALTDTATTGPSTAQSGALGGSADLRIATAFIPDGSAPGANLACGPFSENLATGPFTVSIGAPHSGTVQDGRAYFCVTNDGSQPVDLSLDIFDGVDVDFACTGDEALNGDASCGSDGAGELSAALHNEVDVLPSCDPGAIAQAFTHTLAQMSAAPTSLTTLGPGMGKCFGIQLYYPEPPQNTLQAIQQAQSDRFSWRYRFIAQA